MATAVVGIPMMGTSILRKYMQSKYIQCLCRAGAEVKILDPIPKVAVIKRYISECNGFLFPGGADIAPELYGQKPQPSCGKPNPLRDSFEFPLMSAVLEREAPVLCICRGMQLLNISLGGTLIQDIKPTQQYNHADLYRRTKYAHPVSLSEGSLAAEIFGCTAIQVNSLHHQVVDKLGKDLRVTAKSPEGFVEAIEFQSRKIFVFGLQWHPELMTKSDLRQQEVFNRFIFACSK